MCCSTIQHLSLSLSLCLSRPDLTLPYLTFASLPYAGASPISKEVMTFLRICFGAKVLEGYGMTESGCTISITRPEDLTTGTCQRERASEDLPHLSEPGATKAEMERYGVF